MTENNMTEEQKKELREERARKHDEVWEAAAREDCTLADIEDIIGDDDFAAII